MTLATIVNCFDSSTNIWVVEWNKKYSTYITFLEGIVDELTYDLDMKELENYKIDMCTVKNNQLRVWLVR